MKSKFKRMTSILLVFVTLCSFSMNAFAATKTITAKAEYASKLMTTKTCTFKKSTDKKQIKVTNSGQVSVMVYVGGIYKTTLRPGKTYTFNGKSGWFTQKSYIVKVYAKDRDKLGRRHKITIKTSSGSIS